jgi:hypothetical protein
MGRKSNGINLNGMEFISFSSDSGSSKFCIVIYNIYLFSSSYIITCRLILLN